MKEHKIRFEAEDLDQTDEAFGERCLLRQVLARAFFDATQRSVDITPHDRYSARQWFQCGGKGAFSFLWICSELDLSEKIRVEILECVFDPIKTKSFRKIRSRGLL